MKAGQHLCQIDPLTYQTAYDSARASLARAEATQSGDRLSNGEQVHGAARPASQRRPSVEFYALLAKDAPPDVPTNRPQPASLHSAVAAVYKSGHARWSSGRNKVQSVSWHVEADGDLSAEIGDWRLVIHTPPDGDLLVHFMLLRQLRGREKHVLLASGTEDNVQAAKDSAIRMAERSMR